MPYSISDRTAEMVLSWIALATLAASLTLASVNPWPQDNWFSSQYNLFGQYHGTDNYVPVAAPAIVYWLSGVIARLFGTGIDTQFYVISVVQNLFVFLAFFLSYLSCKYFVGRVCAATITLAVWFFFVSTGTAQACWSENITILLISAATYITIRCASTENLSNYQLLFWSILCGLAIGLAAATRVIPILLVPALAAIFISQHSVKKGMVFVGIIGTTSAICVASVILTNGYRFDKLSLSDSAGRHLWNGVMTFSIDALDGNSQFDRLRQSNPQIEKTQWWQLEFPGAPKIDPYNAYEYDTQWGAYNQYIEGYLRPLALQAIQEKPELFIYSGLKKLYENIKSHPMRYGFSKGSYNPLVTTEFLPPLAMLTEYPAMKLLVDQYDKITARFHYYYGLIYPITIFILLTTFLHVLLSPLAVRQNSRNPKRMRVNVIYFVSVTLLSILLIRALTSGFGHLRSALVSVSSFMIILMQVYLSTRSRTINGFATEVDQESSEKIRRISLSVVFTIFILLFFGSIFVSWSIEVANPRAVLPYLPLYSLLLCLSIRYWSLRRVK